MLRENLKAAIAKSGMIVKEIAARSGVNKRTIDKWVGASETEPKVNDLYKVCRVLEATMEWLVDGEDGAGYVRQWVKNEGKIHEPPERIADIVNSILGLSDRELNIIRGAIRGMCGDGIHDNKVETNPPGMAGERTAV